MLMDRVGDATKLEQLTERLEHLEKSKRDYIVDSRQLHAWPTETTIKLVVPIPKTKPREIERLPLTEHAHRQVADKLEIPWRYYDRMRQSHNGQLLSQNVNAWLPARERRLVRILDWDGKGDKIRALLSDHYRIMDNYAMFFLALKEFKKRDVVVHRADLTETHMYLKAIIPHTREEIRKGDSVIPGIVLRNSEVGASAFRVEPFLLRELCSNGMIGPAHLARIHLGPRKGIGRIASRETMRLTDKLVASQVKDLIKATFDPKIFKEWVKQLRDNTEVEMDEPTKAVEAVSTNFGMSEKEKESLLKHFTSADEATGAADYTQYGMVNGITRVARDLQDDNPDRAVELESAAGQFSAMPESELRQVLKQVEDVLGE